MSSSTLDAVVEYLRCVGCGERIHPSGVHHTGRITCTLADVGCPHQWAPVPGGVDVAECVLCGTWATTPTG